MPNLDHEAEHEGILKERKNKSCGISWNEYKSMTFTFKVKEAFGKLLSCVVINAQCMTMYY